MEPSSCYDLLHTLHANRLTMCLALDGVTEPIEFGDDIYTPIVAGGREVGLKAESNKRFLNRFLVIQSSRKCSKRYLTVQLIVAVQRIKGFSEHPKITKAGARIFFLFEEAG